MKGSEITVITVHHFPNGDRLQKVTENDMTYYVTHYHTAPQAYTVGPYFLTLGQAREHLGICVERKRTAKE